MTSNTRSNVSFIRIPNAARRLGVPIAWLEAEIRANRLPSLEVGNRRLVCVAQLESRLLELANDLGPGRAFAGGTTVLREQMDSNRDFPGLADALARSVALYEGVEAFLRKREQEQPRPSTPSNNRTEKST